MELELPKMQSRLMPSHHLAATNNKIENANVAGQRG